VTLMLFFTGSSRASVFSDSDRSSYCCSAGSAAFFRLHCKARSSLRVQGSSCSRRPLSPLTVSSSHLRADPVLIGENIEFLAAIDSRFNISEVVLQLSPLSGSSGHCPCSGSWSGWRGLTRWSSPCPHSLWLLVSSLKVISITYV